MASAFKAAVPTDRRSTDSIEILAKNHHPIARLRSVVTVTIQAIDDQGDTMAAETPDRRVNTDAKIENDGVKRQPHERDESPDGQDQAPTGVMKQAASDLEQGLVDTDLRNTPGVAPTGGAGEAKPQADRGDAMRDHDNPTPTRGNQ
jgi:hypothetical protein